MNPAEQILIVEDDVKLAGLLADYLEEHGFAVSICPRGDHAVQHVERRTPSIVILDVMLPGLDGLEVCKRIRRGYGGPILMMTAQKDAATEVRGLELGADDYVHKPIEPRTLLARIRALLRRIDVPVTREGMEVGPLTLDWRTRTVCVHGSDVPMTTTEFHILWLLGERPGDLVTRRELYEKVLDTEYDGLDRGMDVHVSRIRTKLGANGLPSAIKSVRGAGYVLVLR